MRIVGIKETQFVQFAKKHRYRNYYQSVEYGNTMMKFGYNIQYLGIINDKNTLIGLTNFADLSIKGKYDGLIKKIRNMQENLD